tara:strand:- start:48 stop:344 length:297 start_codon:yes stop_codon:yes gene_type:complete
MYYNTNKETGKTLKRSQRKANSQENMILAIFKENPRAKFTPETVLKKLQAVHLNYPITSIRRAMSNLKDDGYLEKTNEKANGDWGKKVHLWKIGKRPG